MGKYIMTPAIFYLLFLAIGCNEVNRNTICDLEQNTDANYFKTYFEDHSGNDTFYVDSISFLYASMNLYKVDDSTLVFVSYYNKSILLLLNVDSIRVFRPQGEDPYWSTRVIYDMLVESNIDSVIRYVGCKTNSFYRNSLSNKVQVLIGFEKKNKNRLVFIDYHNSAYYYRGGFFHDYYYYEKTVKNNLINMNRIKLKNHNNINNNSILYDKR